MKINLKTSEQEVNFTLGDLTILCGENGTGKSFVLGGTFSQFKAAVPNSAFWIGADRRTKQMPPIHAIQEQCVLAKQYPDLLQEFEAMIGGSYGSEFYSVGFIPANSKHIDPSTPDSVYNLFAFWFYLKCVAKPGGIVFIEEPELGLHPAWQRKMARFLARLINYGVKVLVTTHSDYIVKEFNTLIMMRQNEHTREIAVEEGYREDELLEHTNVCAYDTEMVDGHITLKPMDVDAEQGVWVPSFDNVIDDVNRICDRLLYERD